MRKWLWAMLLVALALAVAGCGDDDDDGGGDGEKAPRGRYRARPRATWPGASARTPAAPTARRSTSSRRRTRTSTSSSSSCPSPPTSSAPSWSSASTPSRTSATCSAWTRSGQPSSRRRAGSRTRATSSSRATDDFIPSTLETAKYEDKYWAVPYHTNAGFLYYRTNEVKQAPDAWEDVYSEAGEDNGIVYQGAAYEGLTVNFLELLYSGGGKVLSDDGQSVEIDSPEGEAALEFMADGVKNGDAPKAVTTYMEEESRRAFEAGKATFMRNWPYAYALGKESEIADQFDIATFPSFEGGEPASVLGGINLAISEFAKNPEGAAAFIDYATGPVVQKTNFLESASPPATAAPYDDPEVQKKNPFASDLKAAVEQGQVRPVSPVYPQITEAIYTNVHDALQGNAEPKAALDKMKSQIEQALETF